MKALRSVTCLALLLPIMGIAHVAPAGAVPASPVQIAPIISSQGPTLQTVDCRRHVHTHRRCTLRRGGICRRWITYTHRCG